MLVLILWTDRLIPLLDLSEWDGSDGVKINRLFFMKLFVGQQSDLEHYSKFYWQPIKGTKQWNTVSERR